MIQDFYEASEDLVATRMSQTIVPLLEIVDVDENETERLFGPDAAFALEGDRVLEVAMVVEFGEAVGDRELFEHQVDVRKFFVLGEECSIRGFDLAMILLEFPRITSEPATHFIESLREDSNFVSRSRVLVNRASALADGQSLRCVGKGAKRFYD